ncbi:hypothetical protein SERLA73DRAFT_161549 [Serpula lacrymans var. lacrymans S7.3]|uniref:PIPK domain-containing protein n=1 Tax=Serpula lacrymans var. lacrymans (strain S7.3) TaxID=936435 RepID=F8Q305_SERL3|nr:hypothetical protein SERLA73DRAFT_161549 [Serpula lacrymans var. lacrymans S7.3]
MVDKSQKPLPSVPRHPQIRHNLHEDARAHLKKFIEEVLAEDDSLSSQYATRESWAEALEAGLESLGESISAGGWLTGFRRARNAEKIRPDTSRASLDHKKDEKTVEEVPGKANTQTSDNDTQSKASDEVIRRRKTHSSSTNEDDTYKAQTLERMRAILSLPAVPVPKPLPKHLLLCVSALAGDVVPSGDHHSSATSMHTAVQCIFREGTFDLPEAISDNHRVLCGLGWHDNSAISDSNDVRVVGGSFTLVGVTSPLQHELLCKVLRISLYTYLSLLLETFALLESHAQLQFPKPRRSPLPPVPHHAEEHPVKRPTLLSPGHSIFSFFTKKKDDFLHRTFNISPVVERGGSFDLPISGPFHNHNPTPASADSTFTRLRSLSFVSDRLSTPIIRKDDTENDPPFMSTLRRIEKYKALLSTSPGVSSSVSPPSLLTIIAEKEKSNPSRLLQGDEKAGLTTILGWSGRDVRGKGMTGLAGFVRHQEISFLRSEQVPSTSSSTLAPASDSTIPSPSATQSPSIVYKPCRKAQWVTFLYYSRHADGILGQTIIDWCSEADKPCYNTACSVKRGAHETRWYHGNLKITVNICSAEVGSKENGDNIVISESCKVCGEKTERVPMSDGTHLLSFAKYLELLLYSPYLCGLARPLCEHMMLPQRPWPTAEMPIPHSRFNIIRHFSYRKHAVSFSVTEVDDIYDLQVPRSQILKNNGSKTPDRIFFQGKESDQEEARKVLRREIKAWWQAVSDHMDSLEIAFDDHSRFWRKTLPRLPSEDDAYDGGSDDTHTTPKARVISLPPLPSSTSDLHSPMPKKGDWSSHPESISLPPTKPSSPQPGLPISPTAQKLAPDNVESTPRPKSTLPSILDQDAQSLLRLSSLRHSFQRTEQSLYTQLSQTPVSTLNDVRHSFICAARGASKRLNAWQTKHLPRSLGKGKAGVGFLSVQEPSWWSKGCHAVPGGNFIIQEDDWGSIIAFTLSCTDFQRELSGMASNRSIAADTSVPTTPNSISENSSFFSANSLRFFSSSAKPDPDQEGVVWYEADAYSAVITRKEHSKEYTSLLSFKDVLRQRAPGELSSERSSSSGVSSGGISLASYAKPAVEVNLEHAGGEVSGLPEATETRKLLQELDASSASDTASLSGSVLSNSEFIQSHIQRGNASMVSTDSNSTVGPDTNNINLPPSPPPKDPAAPQRKDSASTTTSQLLFSENPAPTPTSSNFGSTLSSGFTNAMRYFLSTGEGSQYTAAQDFRNKHGLLLTDSLYIDERPHIKYDWTIGKRLKFSCTVYYAKQFDGLRRKCGIEDIFVKSLSRSTNWMAEGGKSKSNFWKTTDDRFIIKTLVNAWNVADLQVLNDLAPSYFRYMESTAGKPTVLAKLLGFYTVEIRNLESGTTQAKADLLVMENLFYGYNISKTFDLKGIQERKVKPNGVGPQRRRTLFDGEWVEDQQRSMLLIRPHSKYVIREAIKNDAEFLAKSNIMDYSLLLGVDEGQKRIVCGLVDTIGSYTFAKTLEYKAKHGLTGGKAVTVVPPAEYQQRFVTSMDDYFVACPDKWSRGVDLESGPESDMYASRRAGDWTALPNVL